MHWMRGVDEETQARLVAYKAHKLGRDSIAFKQGPSDAKYAQACLDSLERREETSETILMRIFYTLVLAEIRRSSDPVPDRMKAQKLGERIKSMGFTDPFPLYMEIIKTTTNSLTAGNFGDLKTRGSNKIQDSTTYIDRFGDEVAVDLAQGAVGLPDREIPAHSHFLNKSLQELVRLHWEDS